jgi:hypothetical protein
MNDQTVKDEGRGRNVVSPLVGSNPTPGAIVFSCKTIITPGK